MTNKYFLLLIRKNEAVWTIDMTSFMTFTYESAKGITYGICQAPKENPSTYVIVETILVTMIQERGIRIRNKVVILSNKVNK